MRGAMCFGWSSWAARSLAVLAVVMTVVAAPQAGAATLYANPGDNLTSIIGGMSPGDTLILNPGDYYNTIRVTNKHGDPDHWFTVRGSDAGVARIVAPNLGYAYNHIELRLCSYWRFENFEVDGNNFTPDDAIKASINSSTANDYVHHIVFDGLNIHHANGNGISTKVAAWDIEIRNCYIHDLLYPGAYLGNSDGYLPIMNLTFENNIVERTLSYNIQVKQQNERVGVARGDTLGLEFDTWGWLIKDNVFMRDEPTDWDRPNVLIDAAPLTGPGSDDVGVLCGNVVLGNTAAISAESGFQVSGNLQIYNNVIMGIVANGYSGIKVTSHAGIVPRNFEITNNTVFLLSAPTGASCLSVYSADTTPGLTRVVANNALIHGSAGGIAFSGSLPAGTIVTNNIVRGSYGGLSGFTPTAAALDALFVNPTETPGLVDLYPAVGSPLIGAGDNAHASAVDFNGVPRPRGGTVEVGAYEVLGDVNPGWQVALAAKRLWQFGDLDHDGDVDIEDYTSLAAVMDGPGAATANVEADAEDDGDCDLADFRLFAENFTDQPEVDITAPADVTDLDAQTGVAIGQIVLAWTAPGDDGTTGRATLYDLRYAETAITEGNWDSATPVAGTPVPQEAGAAEELTVTGLTAGVTYFFGLKTFDEVGNGSDLSNVASAEAAGAGDLILQQGLDGYAGCIDAHMLNNDPDTNHDDSTILWVSAFESLGETQRALVRFDLSHLAPTTTITSAKLMLYTYIEHGPSGTYEVHSVTQNWTESGATWTNYAAGLPWTTPGGDFGPTLSTVVKPATTANIWIEWDVTAVVQSWLVSPSSNKGVLIKGDNEYAGFANRFYPSEYATDATLRPKLILSGVSGN